MSDGARRAGARWRAAQARDAAMLPSVPRIVRPGSFGTFPEDTRQGGPKAPTLSDGPLFTGEGREEVNGAPLSCPAGANVWTPLANLRRPWPFVGFAVDLSQFPAGTTIGAALVVLMRSGRAFLFSGAGTVIPSQIVGTTPIIPGQPWLALAGIYAGARVEVVINHNAAQPVKVRANVWGYDDPAYGP